MTHGYRVEVTDLDVKEGIRGNTCNCMVQVAIGRAIPSARRIEVTAQTIRFSVDDGPARRIRMVYLTPRAVREYVIAFDAGDEIQPFAFTLEHPQVAEMPITKPGTARSVSFASKGKGSGERRSLRVFGERAYRANQVAG